MYTKDSFVSIEDEYVVQCLPRTVSIHGDIRLEHIHAVVRGVKIEPDCVSGEVTILDVPGAKTTAIYLDEQALVVRPRSEAKISDGVVTECKIIGFDFVDKYKDSFNFESNY